jgi:TorA maturation chaperone TorD
VDNEQQLATTTGLQAEAEWLHRALFGCPPREVLLSRYAEALRHVLLQADARESLTVQKVVECRLDAEAEATDGYHEFFTNRRDSRAAAFASLAAAALRTPVKKLRGKYLVWRHKLV